jgi:hypothetical protein
LKINLDGEYVVDSDFINKFPEEDERNQKKVTKHFIISGTLLKDGEMIKTGFIKKKEIEEKIIKM